MKKKYTGTWESVKGHQVPGWYEDCKFGVFIHWGIYSVPAYAPRTWELGEVEGNEEWFCNNPYAEWYYNSINVGIGPTYQHHVRKYGKDFQYDDFIPMWKAEKWNPAQWAGIFKKAGARYVVLTTKHHDGFCLFQSKYTDFHTLNMGPKKDITRELTDSVREAGLKMGLYYSGLIDWQYANDPIFTDGQNFSNACPTYEYADYSYNQMRELVDLYQPSIFWNDIGWPKQSEHAMPYFLAHYYNQVEDGVVNDRFNGLYHDYTTKEYQYGKATRGEKWEMCRGMGLSFGYNENESDKHLISLPKLVNLLVSTVANNGNLLLNIGPKADGTIPEEQVKRLLALGDWLTINGEGIYETRCSRRVSVIQENGLEFYYTKKDKDLYFFIDGLKEGQQTVCVPGVPGPVTSLDRGLHIENEVTDKDLRLTLKNYQKEMYAVGFKAAGQD